jgi:hypothetical protein
MPDGLGPDETARSGDDDDPHRTPWSIDTVKPCCHRQTSISNDDRSSTALMWRPVSDTQIDVE